MVLCVGASIPQTNNWCQNGSRPDSLIGRAQVHRDMDAYEGRRAQNRTFFEQNGICSDKRRITNIRRGNREEKVI
jgi:hypothetical protein